MRSIGWLEDDRRVSEGLRKPGFDTRLHLIPPERTQCQGSSPVRAPAKAVASSYFIQEPSGLPEFPNVSLLACHVLRTPADIRALAMNQALYIAFQYVNTVGIRNKPISKLYLHFRESDLPCCLQASLCTITPSIVRRLPHYAMESTLHMGG